MTFTLGVFIGLRQGKFTLFKPVWLVPVLHRQPICTVDEIDTSKTANRIA